MRAVCISATFLNAAYHGEEWPPSPARLVQALVAGVNTGQYRRLWPSVEPGLRWLEQQAAPEVFAVGTTRGNPFRLAVPNNDMDAIAREWIAGRPASPAALRTMKPVRPRFLEDTSPHVRYLWKLQEDDAAGSQIIERLRPLSHCLHTFGWGVDMSFAEAALLDDLPLGFERWVPSHAGSANLAVPVPGFLEDLQSTYARFRGRASSLGANADTRPSVYRMQRYAREGQQAGGYCVFELKNFADAGRHSEDWASAIVVAGRMRHAAASALRREEFAEDFVQSFIEGHTGDGVEPLRMSYAPLPSIARAHDHSDGRIRRVMFVEPREGDGRALRMLELALPSIALLDERGGREVCRLSSLKRDSTLDLYTATSPIWRSVTPVVLHGFNSARGRVSLKKTHRLIYTAFEMAGYRPEMIESFTFQPAPLWIGTGAAFQVRLPAHLRDMPRYHIQVRFRCDVGGPVLAGIGRHSGLGVFAAWPEKRECAPHT